MPKAFCDRLVAITQFGANFGTVSLTVDDSHNAVGTHVSSGHQTAPRLKSFERSVEAYVYFTDMITVLKEGGADVLYLGRPYQG
jgi:hypothetical protein